MRRWLLSLVEQVSRRDPNNYAFFALDKKGCPLTIKAWTWQRFFQLLELNVQRDAQGFKEFIFDCF